MNFRSFISTILLLLMAVFTYAQQPYITYFDADWKQSTKEQSTYYRVTKPLDSGNKYEVTDYYNSGKLQMTGIYASLSPEIKDGVFTCYDENGEKTSESVFEKGKLKRRKYFGEESDGRSSLAYLTLETHPQYPGGNDKLYQYLGNNFKYPKGLKPRPKGTIPVCFVIEKDGSVVDVYVKDSLHPLLDAEAIRVLENMPKWEPGLQDGKPVRVMYTIPITVK